MTTFPKTRRYSFNFRQVSFKTWYGVKEVTGKLAAKS
jgi:hypothetical protein